MFIFNVLRPHASTRTMLAIGCMQSPLRERERKFNLSIQPALACEDVSMLEPSAKLRKAGRQ